MVGNGILGPCGLPEFLSPPRHFDQTTRPDHFPTVDNRAKLWSPAWSRWLGAGQSRHVSSEDEHVPVDNRGTPPLQEVGGGRLFIL